MTQKKAPDWVSEANTLLLAAILSGSPDMQFFEYKIHSDKPENTSSDGCVESNICWVK